MDTHVKILGALHILLGILAVIAGLAVWALFGGLALLAGLDQAGSANSLLSVPVINLVGMVILGIAVILALPSLITGIGLLRFRPWARVLGIVLSALHLVNVPIGTAVGLYGLWVLLSAEAEYLFHPPQATRQAFPR